MTIVAVRDKIPWVDLVQGKLWTRSDSEHLLKIQAVWGAERRSLRYGPTGQNWSYPETWHPILARREGAAEMHF